MNNKKQKQVKLFCSRLPVSYEIVRIGKVIDGGEVLEKVVNGMQIPETMNISDINPALKYKVQNSQIKQINHYRRVKRAYDSRKEQGVIEYIKWLKVNNEQMNKHFKKLGEDSKISTWNNELDEFVKNGADGFWRTLIRFLLSFMTIFSKK